MRRVMHHALIVLLLLVHTAFAQDFLTLVPQRFFFDPLLTAQPPIIPRLHVASNTVRQVGTSSHFVIITNTSILLVDESSSPGIKDISSVLLGPDRVCVGGAVSVEQYYLTGQKDAFVYADSCRVCLCRSVSFLCKCTAFTQTIIGAVKSVSYAYAVDYGMLIADRGLFSFTFANPEPVSIPLFTPTNDVAHAVTFAPAVNSSSSRTLFFVGTSANLYTFEAFNPAWLRRDYVNGIIDASINSLSIDPLRRLWIGTGEAVNVLHIDLYFLERVDWNQGLSVGQVTTVVATNDFVMVGGPQGVSFHPYSNDYCAGTISPFGKLVFEAEDMDSIRWVNYDETCWVYIASLRWLPDNSVVRSAAMADGSVLVTTQTGVSHFSLVPDTWKAKSSDYLSQVSARHNRFGLVAMCQMSGFGVVDSCRPQPNDNDGLWTSLMVASEVLITVSTRSTTAPPALVSAFEAMKKLVTVTGIKGLMARSFDLVSNPGHDPNNHWYNSTSQPGWAFKADASSDEVTGHMFAHTLVADYLSTINATLAQEAADILVQIAGYIVSNKFYLVDVTGKPTKWGVWDPALINNVPFWYDGRGLNSLQMLAWCLVGLKHSGDDMFVDAIQFLVDSGQYDVNILNTMVTVPEDYNHSDDELTFWNYVTFAHGLHENPYLSRVPSHLRSYFFQSLIRSYRFINREKPSLYTAMFYYMFDLLQEPVPRYMDRNEHLAAARSKLARYPRDLVDWPLDETLRIDVRIDYRRDRDNRLQSAYAFDSETRSCLWWNCSPFELTGGSGTGEDAGTVWLLPFSFGLVYGYW
eukprot:ANDGO_06469.mRNA.1 hypothetical protein